MEAGAAEVGVGLDKGWHCRLWNFGRIVGCRGAMIELLMSSRALSFFNLRKERVVVMATL